MSNVRRVCITTQIRKNQTLWISVESGESEVESASNENWDFARQNSKIELC